MPKKSTYAAVRASIMGQGLYILLGMVEEARSVNVNNTTTKTSCPQSCRYFVFLRFLGRAFFLLNSLSDAFFLLKYVQLWW